MDFYPIIVILGLALFVQICVKAGKKIQKERKAEHFGIFDGLVANMINMFIGMIAGMIKWVFNKILKLTFELFTRFLYRLKVMIMYILKITRINIHPNMKKLLIGTVAVVFVGTVAGTGLYLYRKGQESVDIEVPPIVVPSIGGKRGYKQKYFRRSK